MVVARGFGIGRLSQFDSSKRSLATLFPDKLWWPIKNSSPGEEGLIDVEVALLCGVATVYYYLAACHEG